jgi:hypothetical protein
VTDPGDLDRARRRHPSAYEYEHDLDPPDHADAYLVFEDPDPDGDEIVGLYVVEDDDVEDQDVEDVDLGPDARVRFDFLVDDELDRRNSTDLDERE